jgi:hypothetical protein
MVVHQEHFFLSLKFLSIIKNWDLGVHGRWVRSEESRVGGGGVFCIGVVKWIKVEKVASRLNFLFGDHQRFGVLFLNI